MTNIIFAGTPAFAAFHLDQLINSNLAPSLILTQPDRQAGRGRKLKASPVKELADKKLIPVYQPQKIDQHAKDFLQKLSRPDLLIVVAYGLLLPKWLLDWPKYGAINVHASLLPRWRGAAPIQRSIIAGDHESGVCIMQMDEGLDTGAIWQQSNVPITDKTNAQLLHDQLQEVGAKALIQTIPDILSQSRTPTAQSKKGITYAKKLQKSEAKINWQLSAIEISRLIRGFNPTPVAFSDSNQSNIFRFFDAIINKDQSLKNPGEIINKTNETITIKCGQDAITITELQETGKKRMSVRDYLNGRSIDHLQFI